MGIGAQISPTLTFRRSSSSLIFSNSVWVSSSLPRSARTKRVWGAAGITNNPRTATRLASRTPVTSAVMVVARMTISVPRPIAPTSMAAEAATVRCAPSAIASAVHPRWRAWRTGKTLGVMPNYRKTLISVVDVTPSLSSLWPNSLAPTLGASPKPISDSPAKRFLFS